MDNHSIAKLSKEKGNIAFKAEDYATARSLFSHAMAFDPSNHIYPLNRSQANLKLERWDEAEADATKTLDLSPHNLKALLRRGKARKELGKWDQARVDIQMFIDNKGDPTLAAQELKAIADAESSPPSKPSSCGVDGDLANLHLQDDSDSSFFYTHTTEAVQNGQGAFASRDIRRGDLILSEKPIFCMPISGPEPLVHNTIVTAVRNLSPTHLDSYLSLQNSHDTCSCFSTHLMGLFGTNAITVSDGNGGVCLGAARFNHSCSPNAKYSFNSNTGEVRIYALGTIRRGEEIFVAYVSIYGSRRSRRANLRPGYHFTCRCSVCSLPEAESKMSDTRREKLNELLVIIGRLNTNQGVHFLTFVAEAVRLLQEEGCLAGVDDFTPEAGALCSYHSDWVSARYWAGLTYRARVAEFGEDSPQAAEVRELYMNPKSFRFAGLGPPKDFTGIRV